MGIRLSIIRLRERPLLKGGKMCSIRLPVLVYSRMVVVFTMAGKWVAFVT